MKANAFTTSALEENNQPTLSAGAPIYFRGKQYGKVEHVTPCYATVTFNDITTRRRRQYVRIQGNFNEREVNGYADGIILSADKNTCGCLAIFALRNGIHATGNYYNGAFQPESEG